MVYLILSLSTKKDNFTDIEPYKRIHVAHVLTNQRMNYSSRLNFAFTFSVSERTVDRSQSLIVKPGCMHLIQLQGSQMKCEKRLI